MTDGETSPDSRQVPEELVVLDLEDRHYALPLPNVETVERAVDVTPLPGAPDLVMGIVCVRDRVIPVIDVRQRFHLPRKEIELSDQMVIARTRSRTVAMVVDRVGGVIHSPESARVPIRDVYPDLRHVRGVVKLEDGLVLIQDLDEFLSYEEESDLADALERASQER